MHIPTELQSSLYYYDLTLIQRENNLFSLVDLKTGEWYEKMTIYYVQRLLEIWNKKRRNIIL